MYRHGALDNDLRARLHSPNFEVFLQAVGEIQAAWFLERRVGFRFSRFRPRGQGNHVGEFEMTRDRTRVFVEVKSPIRSPAVGLMVGDDRQPLIQNVQTACQQIPTDGRATLVVLTGDLRLPGGDPFSGVTQALVGDLQIEVPLALGQVPVPLPGPPKITWTGTGVFQPNAYRHLSAVATLHDIVGSPRLDAVMNQVLEGTDVEWNLPEWSLSYSFRIYHNPFATIGLSRRLFEGWEQWGSALGRPATFGRVATRRSKPRRR
jgi:hypothetical protein